MQNVINEIKLILKLFLATYIGYKYNYYNKSLRINIICDILQWLYKLNLIIIENTLRLLLCNTLEFYLYSLAKSENV